MKVKRWFQVACPVEVSMLTDLTMKELQELKKTTDFAVGKATYYDITLLDEWGLTKIEKLPHSIRVLLENAVRNVDGKLVTIDDVIAIAKWPEGTEAKDIAYMPSRVVLQDFTGVPLIVDLASMRDAVKKFGGDPALINPVIQTDLVVDHSVQVDFYGMANALNLNLQKEYERNKERYSLLKWAQNAFENFRVIPPGSGIVHQVNLEYLGKVAHYKEFKGEPTAYPDTLLGTDSHTTMINGLGIMGWGVGGIEAEAVMLGQPYYMLLPEVIGVQLEGELPEGATATDLVLTVTQMLRKRGVVGKFVEYFGSGLDSLSVPDRATLANMSPEYGATMGFFPVDDMTLKYLLLTGRDPTHVKFVEEYLKLLRIFRMSDQVDPTYSDVLKLDLSTVEPSLSGPSNPEDRIPMRELKKRMHQILKDHVQDRKRRRDLTIVLQQSESSDDSRVKELEDGLLETTINLDGEEVTFRDGSLVISAITSCTNTSNPSVMIGAGLVAKKAVELGLTTKPYVKTSLSPGSFVVREYLKELGLISYLETLKFHVVGFGCMTCIGNSGPINPVIEEAIKRHDLYATSILSGNRNFAGRIHQSVRGNFLASPMLVVAFALAGRLDIDPFNEPLAHAPDGKPVYLKDIWPTQQEINEAIEKAFRPDVFKQQYARILEGDLNWQALKAPTGTSFQWDPQSTYIRNPPYFDDFKMEIDPPKDINGARVLVLLGDRISTDHISPAGAIDPESPAGKYLIEHGVEVKDFNTYGSRRGNHEVMMRGGFANVRVRNLLTPDKEGWWTKHIPTGEVMPIYDAAMKYKQENTPVIVLAGAQYGVGSSRDWAAKAPALLGVKAVIANSYERIHRSNLIGMGVLPLQFKDGEGWQELGLDGTEEYTIQGISDGLTPRKELKVTARKSDGTVIEFTVLTRLDTPVEVDYYVNGGILPAVLRQMLKN